MKPETMMIDDVKYVREDSIQKTTPVDESTEPLRIIMNDDRGLCIVGNVDLNSNDFLLEIKNARCIIRWGTTGHLAEIADKGVLPNTKLGHVYTHKMPRNKIALVLECNMENW